MVRLSIHIEAGLFIYLCLFKTHLMRQLGLSELDGSAADTERASGYPPCPICRLRSRLDRNWILPCALIVPWSDAHWEEDLQKAFEAGRQMAKH